MEDVAQVRPRLRLGRIGPEEEGETLPGLCRLPVEEEVGEQRLCPGRLEPWQRRLAGPKVEFAEESDLERRRVPGPSVGERDLRGRRRRANIPGWRSHISRIFATGDRPGKTERARRTWLCALTGSCGRRGPTDVEAQCGDEMLLSELTADGDLRPPGRQHGYPVSPAITGWGSCSWDRSAQSLCSQRPARA